MTAEIIEGEFTGTNVETIPTSHYGVKPMKEDSVRAVNARSKARLQAAVAEIANAGSAKVLKWLDQVAERNPAEAVKLMMEWIEFTQPRLKAAQVVIGASANLTPGGPESLRSLSAAELEEMARGES